MRVRILTLNVMNLEGDPRRQAVLNSELRRLDPDLVSFQEVVQTPERDQLKELLAGTELRGTHQAQALAYEPAYADRFGGTAVATRWPHRVVETLDLRTQGETIGPWCTLAAVVDIPDEGEMLFIATVTSAGLGYEYARERHAVALTDLDARHRCALPTVMAGDFNADPDAASIRYLKGRQSLAGQSVLYHDAWALAGEGPGYTWSAADNPIASALMDQIVRQPRFRLRIDYVFVGSAGFQERPGAHASVQRAELAFNRAVDGIWPSDHFGVLVDLDVGKEPLADPDLYPI
jgi:endonuclease/exonuclease/phosphatase family metal-dependent hydrolase